MIIGAFWVNVIAALGFITAAGACILLDRLERRYTKADTDTWNALDDLAPKYAEEAPVKRRTVKADEYDTVSRYWRRCVCCLGRAGVTDAIKRRMRRRERHQARHELHRGDDQG